MFMLTLNFPSIHTLVWSLFNQYFRHSLSSRMTSKLKTFYFTGTVGD